MIKMCLADICSLNMGQSPNSSSYNTTGEGIPFYQGNADFGKVSPKTTTWCTEPKKIAEPGDILLSVRAPIGAINIANEKCCIGRGLVAISPASENIRASYIKQALLASRKSLEFLGSGSTFKAIGKKSLGEFLIPVYSLPMQIEIENRFSQVSICIELLRDVLKKLDELVKSRFVEMFGDIDNTQYEVVTIQDLCEPIKDGIHKTPTYAHGPEDGVMFLSSKDVTTGKIDWNNTKYITPTLHEELKKRVSPRKGDVLLAKNGTTGICAVVDRDEVFDLYVTLALLRPLAGVDSYYLWAAVNADRTKMQFDSRLKGIGVPNLHLKEIKETLLVKPPLSLQREFATFVHQVDKLKFETQQSIEKLQMLYDSLAQEYFAPEGD